MIISYDRKFIFLKVNKTATSSIEYALSKFIGKKDILTPITANGTRLHLGKNVPRRKQGKEIYDHAQPSNIKRYVGPEKWDSFLKVACVRNPWDLQATTYEWRKKKGDKRAIKYNFEEWLTGYLDRVHYSNANIMTSIFNSDGKPRYFNMKKESDRKFYTDKPIFDFIIRYENLEQDFDTLCGLIDINKKVELGRYAVSGRTRSYQEYYNDKTIKMVYDSYRNIIDFYKYSFNPEGSPQ